MADLANIVAAMFLVWIGSGISAAVFAWAVPVAWNRTLRLGVMLGAVVLFVVSTGMLFGVGMAATAAVPAALVAYAGCQRT